MALRPFSFACCLGNGDYRRHTHATTTKAFQIAPGLIGNFRNFKISFFLMEMVCELFTVWWYIFSKRENIDKFLLVELSVFTMSLLVVNLQMENFEMTFQNVRSAQHLKEGKETAGETRLDLVWSWKMCLWHIFNIIISSSSSRSRYSENING